MSEVHIILQRTITVRGRFEDDGRPLEEKKGKRRKKGEQKGTLVCVLDCQYSDQPCCYTILKDSYRYKVNAPPVISVQRAEVHSSSPLARRWSSLILTALLLLEKGSLWDPGIYSILIDSDTVSGLIFSYAFIGSNVSAIVRIWPYLYTDDDISSHRYLIAILDDRLLHMTVV